MPRSNGGSRGGAGSRYTPLELSVQAVKAYCYADALPLSPAQKLSAAVRVFNDACSGYSVQEVDQFIKSCYDRLLSTGSVAGGSSTAGPDGQAAAPSSQQQHDTDMGAAEADRAAVEAQYAADTGSRGSKRGGEQADEGRQGPAGAAKKRRLAARDPLPQAATRGSRKRKLSDTDLQAGQGAAQAAKVRVYDPLAARGSAPLPLRQGVARKRKAGGAGSRGDTKKRRGAVTPIYNSLAKRTADQAMAGESPPPPTKAIKRMRLD